MNTIQNAMNRIAAIEAANAQNEVRQAELAVEQSAVSAATSSLQKKIRFAQLKKQYDVREQYMIAELPAAVTPISPAGTSQIIPITPAVKAKLKGKTSKERQASPLHREGFRLLK